MRVARGLGCQLGLGVIGFNGFISSFGLKVWAFRLGFWEFGFGLGSLVGWVGLKAQV